MHCYLLVKEGNVRSSYRVYQHVCPHRRSRERLERAVADLGGVPQYCREGTGSVRDFVVCFAP